VRPTSSTGGVAPAAGLPGTAALGAAGALGTAAPVGVLGGAAVSGGIPKKKQRWWAYRWRHRVSGNCVQKVKILGGGSGLLFGEGEGGLIENNVSGKNDTVG